MYKVTTWVMDCVWDWSCNIKETQTMEEAQKVVDEQLSVVIPMMDAKEILDYQIEVE